MTAIEVVSGAVALQGMASDVVNSQGYSLFLQHCFKCHSINGVGGTLGPELNTPCSVTEYWNPILLRRFIRQSATVSGSKMPPFQELPENDVESIVGYLKYMSRRKQGGAPCQ